MTQKPHKIHLKISIGGELYVLGTISLNLAKREIYYLFHHSESAPKKLYDINSNQYVDPPNHISWHRERVHIRSEADVLYFVEYPNGDLFPSTPEIRPLLVEGITLNDMPTLLRKDAAFTNFENADEYLQLKLTQVSNFSLVLMLVPSAWTTPDIFNGSFLSNNEKIKIPLWYLRSESHQIFRVLAFKNWDLSIWTTPFVRNVNCLSDKLTSGYRIPDFVKPADSLFDLASQARNCPCLTSQQLEVLRSVANARVDQRIQNLNFL